MIQLLTLIRSSHCVDELSELFLALRIIDDGPPFVVIRSDEIAHLSLKIGADAELIVQQDLSQFLAGNSS